MGAALKLEARMSVEERVANIESDMGHVLSTLADVKNETKELRTELHSFKMEVGKEFTSVRGEIADARAETASLRTEMTKEFGLVRQEIAGARIETGDLRTEMQKGFGAQETATEKLRGELRVWFLLTIGGVLGSLVVFLHMRHVF
jgi:chromosome segregation ATPase